MPDNAWNPDAYDAQFGFVSRYGDDLLDLLGPLPGLRVLDLGCGTGHHAEAMHRAGALVVGLDRDPGMLAKARDAHPTIPFVAADAADFTLADTGVETPFDACFSNAALHWMTRQEAVLGNIRSVLRRGGRFVAEMGGAGNVATLDTALRAALREVDLGDVELPVNYFPTVGEQSVLLERCGFRVRRADWFERPTPLGPDSTPADWTRQFRASVWAAVPDSRHLALAATIDDRAATLGLQDASGWSADYCRLRFVAEAR